MSDTNVVNPRLCLHDHIRAHQNVLSQMVVYEPLLQDVVGVLIQALKNKKKIMIGGNGGSAADAQHIAAELVGRFQKERIALPAIALSTDTSILTALGNDYGYEHIFSRQVEAYAQNGDVLWVLSTSGNSPNILRALEKAKERAICTIAFLGKDGGAAKFFCDYPLVVPSDFTARIQEMHMFLYHVVCSAIDDAFSLDG